MKKTSPYPVPVFVTIWLCALTACILGALGLYLFRAASASASTSMTRLLPSAGTCTASSCGAIDPVNDPDYNMREVLKNTLLIEQHLSEPNKYCKQCIVKHFLISIALLEEATWMAGASRGKFPMLEESLPFHRQLFDAWFARVEDAEARLDVLEKLRVWRREASELYFPT